MYKQAKHRDVPIVPGCTVEMLKAAIWKHLESDYEDTLNAWSDLVTQEHGLFYWTGPEIEIRNCMPTLTRFFTLLPFGEYPQLVDAPIYVVTDGEGGTEKGGDTDMDVDDEANKLVGDLGEWGSTTRTLTWSMMMKRVPSLLNGLSGRSAGGPVTLPLPAPASKQSENEVAFIVSTCREMQVRVVAIDVKLHIYALKRRVNVCNCLSNCLLVVSC